MTFDDISPEALEAFQMWKREHDPYGELSLMEIIEEYINESVVRPLVADRPC